MRSLSKILIAILALIALTWCVGIETTMLETAATRDTLGIGISVYKGASPLLPNSVAFEDKDTKAHSLLEFIETFAQGVNGVKLDIPLRSKTDAVIRLYETEVGSSFGARLGFKQQLQGELPLAQETLNYDQYWATAIIPSVHINYSPGNSQDSGLPRLLAGLEFQYLKSTLLAKNVVFTWGLRGNYTFARYIEAEQIDNKYLHGGLNVNWRFYSRKMYMTPELGVEVFAPLDAENWAIRPSMSLGIGWN